MKGEQIVLSEFVLTKTIGINLLDWEYFADVSVKEDGRWPWSKPVCSRRKIHRRYIGSWHFVDTGEWCPSQADALERAYRAKEALNVA